MTEPTTPTADELVELDRVLARIRAQVEQTGPRYRRFLIAAYRNLSELEPPA